MMINMKAVDISRRRFLASGVAIASTLQLQRAAWALGLGADAQVCVLNAEQEVGPYYVADELLRASQVCRCLCASWCLTREVASHWRMRPSIFGTAMPWDCIRDLRSRIRWGLADQVGQGLAGRRRASIRIIPTNMEGLRRAWDLPRRIIQPTS